MTKAGSDFVAKLSTGEWVVVVAECSGVTVNQKAIVVPLKNASGKEYLDTVVHETVHAALPHATEAEVIRLAKDVTEVLWKRGYRLPRTKKST